MQRQNRTQSSSAVVSSKKESLKAALVQLSSSNSVVENKKTVLNILNEIKEDVDLISFPENTFFLRLNESESVDYVDFDSDFWNPFQDYCKNKKCYLHIGATPLKHEGEKWNATVLIDPSGVVSAPYRKVHLFDIQLENKKPISESSIFKHGSHPVIVDIYGWKVGLTICYDLRFSELFFYYQSKHVDAIMTPAAFLQETGRLHWDILQRARAIESQCYIVAAAQGGHHGEQKYTYGHSMVVSPWGTKVVEILDDSRPSYAICDLKNDEIAKMRKQIPMKQHRRIKVTFE